MSTLNVSSLREDFPILQQTFHDKPLVYLDSAATSQKPESVIRALDTYYRTTNANIHRGIYQLAEQATEQYEAARKQVQKFIKAKSWREIVWTRNATEALNLVAYTYGRANVQAGDEIVISLLEHHSNIVPWQLLAKEKNATLKYIPVDGQGRLALDNLDSLITDRTKIVAVTMMSNVTGAITPLDKIIARAHEVGAVVVVDAAQGVPHLPIDVQTMDVDFLAFSGHKMLGPFVGVLYGKRALLEAMPPFMGGGDMIRKVELYESTWNDLPHKFEAGTPAIAEAIGIGAAVEYLDALGMENVREHEMELTAYALEKLREVPTLRVIGPEKIAERGGLAAFEMPGIHPHDIAAVLDRDAICIRAGHHCAQPLHAHFDLPATAGAQLFTCTIRLTRLTPLSHHCKMSEGFFQMDDLYKEVILDHYQHPRNQGTLPDATHSFEDLNPLCGDRVRMELRIENDIVSDVKFTGKGCAISQAAASMLTDEIKGKSVEEIKHIDKQTVLDMLGIPLGPSRIKCALLPFKVMKASVYGIHEPLEDDDDD